MLTLAPQVMQVCCDVAVDVAVRENAARPVDLGNVICMSDVSGSMSGTPMEVVFVFLFVKIRAWCVNFASIQVY